MKRTVTSKTHLVLAVILLQILVPTIAFFSTPPARFGFQMVAGYEIRDSVVVRDSEGSEIPVDELDLWHAPLRPELNWAERLPTHACSHVAVAHDVVVLQYATGRQVVLCP